MSCHNNCFFVLVNLRKTSRTSVLVWGSRFPVGSSARISSGHLAVLSNCYTLLLTTWDLMRHFSCVSFHTYFIKYFIDFRSISFTSIQPVAFNTKSILSLIERSGSNLNLEKQFQFFFLKRNIIFLECI
jgi:hypothetical protein